jgi:hypothetical protein
MFKSLIKRFKGSQRMTEPTITTRVDRLAEMKAAIDVAINAAERAGVRPAAMAAYFEGCLKYARQRALHAVDQANVTRMHDQHGHPINHHANIARAEGIREEKKRLQSEAEWQESVNRRAEEQAERDGYVR